MNLLLDVSWTLRWYTLLFLFSLFDPREVAEVGLSPTDFPLFALTTDSCWALDSKIIFTNAWIFEILT